MANNIIYKEDFIMHIPDNYLSPSTCATLFVAMTPIWYYSIRKINKTLSADKIPLIGIGGAFAFILMMFNLPIPDGTYCFTARALFCLYSYQCSTFHSSYNLW